MASVFAMRAFRQTVVGVIEVFLWWGKALCAYILDGGCRMTSLRREMGVEYPVDLGVEDLDMR